MNYCRGAQDGEAGTQMVFACGLLDAWPCGEQLV
jgi:hypothetical protein